MLGAETASILIGLRREKIQERPCKIDTVRLLGVRVIIAYSSGMHTTLLSITDYR